MSRYRRLLYLVICLLLSNIYFYVESPETFEIPEDFPTGVGPKTIVDHVKKQQLEFALSEGSDNEIGPSTLIPKNTVDENSPLKAETGTKVDQPYPEIQATTDPNDLATNEELSNIDEKAKALTAYFLKNNKKQLEKYYVKDCPELGSDNRLPILLNLDCLEHDYLNCEFDGSVRIYNVKKNMVFFGVVTDFKSKDSSFTTIWQSKSYYEFANRVIANGAINCRRTNRVSVFFENGKIVHYIKTDIGWIERSPCIEIVLNLRECTYEYIHSKDEHTDVFETRYNFKISKLKLGTGLRPFKSYVDIWEAKNKNQYAKKVECITHTKIISLYVVITLHLFDGNLIKLIERNKQWIPVNPKIILLWELYIDFTGKLFPYRFHRDNTCRIFEAREGFAFNKVKKLIGCLVSEEVIWESQDFNECAYKVITYGFDFDDPSVGKVIVIFHNSGKFTYLKTVDKKWVLIEPSMILDIYLRTNNIGYNYFKDNGEIEYFIPIGACLFKEVIATEGLISLSRVEIWKAKSKSEYAYKAVVIKLEKNSRYLVLLLVNNNILLFHRLDKGHQWMKRSTDNSSLHELKMMGVDLSDPRAFNKQIKYKSTDHSVEVLSSEPSLEAETKSVVPIAKPVPVMRPDKFLDLDITKVYGIRGYDILYKDNKLIFEARDHYRFKSVTKNQEILWQPKNNFDFPNKVLYKRVNNSDKIKVYFPDEEKDDPPKPKMKFNFNPSTIQVEVSNCKKPGFVSDSDLHIHPVVQVSGRPVTNTLENPEDFNDPLPKSRHFRQDWDIDSD